MLEEVFYPFTQLFSSHFCILINTFGSLLLIHLAFLCPLLYFNTYVCEKKKVTYVYYIFLHLLQKLGDSSKDAGGILKKFLMNLIVWIELTGESIQYIHSIKNIHYIEESLPGCLCRFMLASSRVGYIFQGKLVISQSFCCAVYYLPSSFHRKLTPLPISVAMKCSAYSSVNVFCHFIEVFLSKCPRRLRSSFTYTRHY